MLDAGIVTAFLSMRRCRLTGAYWCYSTLAGMCAVTHIRCVVRAVHQQMQDFRMGHSKVSAVTLDGRESDGWRAFPHVNGPVVLAPCPARLGRHAACRKRS